MGVSGSTGVRLRAPVEGSEVTTSGSSRLFSAWSIAATKARDPRESIGIEKTRLALLLHTAHVTDSGAVPSGRVTSNTPSRPHRYSYVATALLLLSQQRHIPTGPQPRPRENANTSVDFRVATTSPRQNMADFLRDHGAMAHLYYTRRCDGTRGLSTICPAPAPGRWSGGGAFGTGLTATQAAAEALAPRYRAGRLCARRCPWIATSEPSRRPTS